jgi:hypothetical protein
MVSFEGVNERLAELDVFNGSTRRTGKSEAMNGCGCLIADVEPRRGDNLSC